MSLSVVADLICDVAKSVAPPPDLTVSQWADKYRRLSREASAEPGQWSTDRAPYQREIMDALSDPLVEGVVVMCGSQSGKTEIVLNTLGYHVHYDPAPILILQPTQKPMAEDFSKDRVAPMVRDTPVLRGKVRSPRSKDSNNTILHKAFDGGHLTIAGANSASSLASRPIRILLADEIDRYPLAVGGEGDPLTLAEQRTTNFWNRKKLFVSTPTVKGISRIEARYALSSRERWCVPCPVCGDLQPLSWKQVRFPDEEWLYPTHECRSCHVRSSEQAWKSMMSKGEWVADNPGAKERGFHLNQLSSPWRSWTEIIDQFKRSKAALDAGDVEPMKVFINTVLAETWEERGEVIEPDRFMERCEFYSAEVPEGGVLLTMGVDVQRDRLEAEVVAWGAGEESWSVDYKVLQGDPTEPGVWDALTTYRTKTWTHESGVEMSIDAVAIDSGDNTQAVYDYVRDLGRERVFPVKGLAGDRAVISGPTRQRAGKRSRPVMLYRVGVDTAKKTVYARLRLESGAGYCHFPVGRDQEYFLQLTAEKLVTRYKKGFPYRVWEKIRARNEALDCRVYAYAAMKLLNPDWEALRRRVAPIRRDVEDEGNKRSAAKRRRRSGGFVGRW